MRKLNDTHGHFLLSLQGPQKGDLKVLLEAKSLGDSKGHGRHGDNGKKGVESERGSSQSNPVLCNSSNGKDPHLQGSDKKRLAGRKVSLANLPKPFPEKVHSRGDPHRLHLLPLFTSHICLPFSPCQTNR